MGCGASSEAVGGKPSRDPNSPTTGKGLRRTYSKADPNVRRSSEGASTGTPPPADPSVLSQALLTDLRGRGPTNTVKDALSRWIENIAQPNDGDNPDLYDPMRRHRLCMDSVEAKKKSARVAGVVVPTTAAPSTSIADASHSAGGPSVAESETGVSEDKTGVQPMASDNVDSTKPCPSPGLQDDDRVHVNKDRGLAAETAAPA